MLEYNLQSTEYVVQKADAVAHRTGNGGRGATVELVLTNENLIAIAKGFFGKSKGVVYLPLNTVKNIDGAVQAVAKEYDLELYLTNGYEKFSFAGKREARSWAERIRTVIGGDAGDHTKSAANAIPGAAFVADTLKDTYDTFKTSFGFNKAPAKVAAKCVSCGASVSGLKGKTIRCPYCDTDQQL